MEYMWIDGSGMQISLNKLKVIKRPTLFPTRLAVAEAAQFPEHKTIEESY